MSTRHEPRRCVAPHEDDEERLCGAPATTERTVEGVVCPLCASCAHQLDSEPNETTN